MDEQTTPKKVRRVGSIAFALVLIAAGVLLMAAKGGRAASVRPPLIRPCGTAFPPRGKA